MSHDFQQWWKDWWQEDFSWEGLEKRSWQGWSVLSDGTIVDRYPDDLMAGCEGQQKIEGARAATLQDYWRDLESTLISSPASGKQFTIMHLPLEWEDGTSTPLFNQLDILQRKIAASAANTFDEVEGNVGPDRRMQLDGCVWYHNHEIETVNGSPHLKKIVAKVWNISANFCFFGSPFISNNAVFLSDANFRSAYFCNARFDGAHFCRQAYFANAVFAGSASFKDTVFEAGCEFYQTLFLSQSNFTNTVFFESANFYQSTFSGACWFDGSLFAKGAGFLNASFAAQTTFKSATFFSEATFRVDDNRDFDARRHITGVQTSNLKELRFFNVDPAANSNPRQVDRAFSNFRIDGAHFLADTNFENRDIQNPSSFRECVFMGKASFHGSTLHQGVSFQGAEFTPALNPDRQSVKNAKGDQRFLIPKGALIRLHHAEAEGRARQGIPEIGLKNWIDAFDAERNNTANTFFGMPQKVSRAAIGKSKDRYYAELEDAFRTLKRAMEDIRNRHEEGRFFKLELLARRKRRDSIVPRWERWMSHVYEWTSDFGNSVTRPLGWLLGLVLIFAGLYACVGTYKVRPPHQLEFLEAVTFSTGQVLPFGPWAKEQKACSTMGRLLDISPKQEELRNKTACNSDLANTYGPLKAFGTRILATLQSALALVFVFLSALAARRRFQIN